MINVYPNPSDGLIRFEVKGELQNARLLIYDIHGVFIYSGFYKQSIDLSVFSGFYFFRIETTSVVQNGMFILTR